MSIARQEELRAQRYQFALLVTQKDAWCLKGLAAEESLTVQGLLRKVLDEYLAKRRLPALDPLGPKHGLRRTNDE